MSCGPLGFDTVSRVNEVVLPAQGKWGTPSFWIRYFEPTAAGAGIDSSQSNALTETRALWDGGARYLCPISAPGDTRVGSGTYNDGLADGNQFASRIHQVWLWVGPLVIPATGYVYCYLNLEYAISLSNNYWRGWATAINTYSGSNFGLGHAPLLASLYCAPSSPAANCSIVQPKTGNENCWTIFNSQPQPCSNCNQFCNGWAATTCSSNDPFVTIWQMTIKDGCQGCQGGTWPNVDTDQSKDNTATDRMLLLNSRP